MNQKPSLRKNSCATVAPTMSAIRQRGGEPGQARDEQADPPATSSRPTTTRSHWPVPRSSKIWHRVGLAEELRRARPDDEHQTEQHLQRPQREDGGTAAGAGGGARGGSGGGHRGPPGAGCDGRRVAQVVVLRQYFPLSFRTPLPSAPSDRLRWHGDAPGMDAAAGVHHATGAGGHGRDGGGDPLGGRRHRDGRPRARRLRLRRRGRGRLRAARRASRTSTGPAAT